MVTESVAILAITFCMIFLFMRGKHLDYAISVAPLLLVPFVHLAASFAMRAFDHYLPSVPYQISLALADMAALAVSCALFTTCAVKIKHTKTKRLYITLMVGYSVLLTCAYVYQTLQPLAAAYIGNI